MWPGWDRAPDAFEEFNSQIGQIPQDDPSHKLTQHHGLAHFLGGQPAYLGRPKD